MPTYGYQCTRCDNAFEVVQKITDPPLSICDQCGSELRKKIFPVGIAFKGAGFYVNDYSNAPAKKTAESAAETKLPAETSKSESEAPASSAAPVAAETKPATPAPTSSAESPK